MAKWMNETDHKVMAYSFSKSFLFFGCTHSIFGVEKETEESYTDNVQGDSATHKVNAPSISFQSRLSQEIFA